MKKEISKTKIFCDCCGIELHKPFSYRNDGSYQENYISIDDEIDLCFTCAGRVLTHLVYKKTITKENVKEIYSDFKVFKDKNLHNN